jgi:putative membrane protein
MERLIHDLDREQIAAAVSKAESRTAGEIVPYVVPQSDEYEVAAWRGASAVALLSITTALMIVQFYQGWGLGWLYTPWAIALIALGGGTLGAVLGAFVMPVQRALAGADLLDETVHAAAMRAFVEEEVFSTRDRTGILLYVSLHEHRIEVLGDTGINTKVEPDEWVDVVRRIRTGIRNENLTAGLVDAIEMCGMLLQRRGIEIKPDDTNELSDAVRTPGFSDPTPSSDAPSSDAPSSAQAGDAPSPSPDEPSPDEPSS